MLKKLIHIFLILSLSFTIFSCSQESEEETEESVFINDPGTPGGNNNGVGRILGVFNVSLDLTTQPGNVILNWQVPSLYLTSDYNVVIFKLDLDNAVAEEIFIDNPAEDLDAFTFEVARLKGNQFIDTDVLPGQEIIYWIFVNLNGDSQSGSNLGEWSQSPEYLVEIEDIEENVEIPSPADFWSKVRFEDLLLSDEFINNNIVDTSLNSWNPNKTDPILIDPTLIKGRVTSARNGAQLYVADTDNNRVVILENAGLLACEDVIDDDLLYFACRTQSAGAPLTPRNILGQSDVENSLSCNDYENKCNVEIDENSCIAKDRFCRWDSNNNSCHVRGDSCLTQPTNILIENGKLLIADSGNDRIVLHESLPDFGCDPNTIPGQTRPITCAASRVFGKQDLNDFNDYDITFAGLSALDKPSGMAVGPEDNALYIADTGHNRVVKITDWNDSSLFNCTPSNWLSPLCGFSAVLGQPDLNTNNTFEQMYAMDNRLLSGTFDNKLELEPDLLKRYFKNPHKIIFHKDSEGVDRLLIGTNEDFEAVAGIGTNVALKGRILMYNTNPIQGTSTACNSVSFNNGGCDADDVIGQESFDELVVISGSSGGSGNYNNTTFGIEFIGDITYFNDILFVTDSINNTVFIWDDFPVKEAAGYPANSKVFNPNGEFIPDENRNRPDLKALTGVSFDPTSGNLFISDSVDDNIYQLDLRSTIILE